jgi:hypothetical protein
VERECRSVRVMGEELHNIGARAQTLLRTGQLYGEAARRLATACRLRRESGNGNGSGGSQGDPPDGAGGGGGLDEEEKLAEEEAVLQRQAAVGDEMVRLFSLLAEVRQRQRARERERRDREGSARLLPGGTPLDRHCRKCHAFQPTTNSPMLSHARTLSTLGAAFSSRSWTKSRRRRTTCASPLGPPSGPPS